MMCRERGRESDHHFMKMDDVERAVGFRFYPSEEELLCYYLPKKLNGTAPELIDTVIPVVPIYDYSPWQLPQVGGAMCREDKEQWFFFTEMQEREGRGGRANRLTATGYWKATGSPRDVYLQNRRVGRKRSMTFYQGRAPNGTKTCWKMNEYKLYQVDPTAPNSSPPDHHTQPQPQLNEDLSLCRVYKTRSNYGRLDQEPLHHRHCTTTTTTTATATADAFAIHQNINPPDVETQFNWDSDAQMLLDWLFDI